MVQLLTPNEKEMKMCKDVNYIKETQLEEQRKLFMHR
jgi:hypothetical protein